MIIGVLVQVLFLILIIFGFYRIFVRGSHRGSGDFSIRRLFQYSLLYLSLVVAGIGASGLLGRVLDSGKVIAESRTDLARNLSFVIVGLPLLYFFGRWSQRSHNSDPGERDSFGWNAYLTVAVTSSLITFLVGAHDLLSWAIGNENFRGSSIAQTVIWALSWYVHWRIARRSSTNMLSGIYLLIGSGIGLALLAVGFGGLIGNSLELLLNYKDQLTVIERTNPLVNSAINILLGAPVWYLYWLKSARKISKDLLWSVYVLLIGVASSFITMVVSASVVIYDLLVWFFGDAREATFARHFFDSATALGSALISLGIWSYHRIVLAVREAPESKQKNELHRVYEYLISGISLIAAALGILMIIVAAVESVTPGDISVGESGANSILLAITLLIVGAPIWWYHWHRIEQRTSSVDGERESPTRRIYILMLFGVAGVAAIGSVITGVFLFLEDLLNGELALETLRSSRFAIGILVTNAAISGYHWCIYRQEREIPIHRVQKGKKITLVGPEDSNLLPNLKSQIKGDLELLIAKDGNLSWNVNDLVALIKGSEAHELLIINEKKGLRAIEIER